MDESREEKKNRNTHTQWHSRMKKRVSAYTPKTPKLGMFVLVATGLCPVLSFFNPPFVLQLFNFFPLLFCFVLFVHYSLSVSDVCVLSLFSSAFAQHRLLFKFLFRLNGFVIHSLKREVKRYSWLLPIQSGRVKIGCQKLACLGLNIGPYFVYTVVVFFSSRHFFFSIALTILIGKFIEWLFESFAFLFFPRLQFDTS